MKIFLLEDNKVFTDQFCRLLKKKDIRYITCSSVQLYKFEKVDVYLIDLQIGSEMSYDIIEDIRKRSSSPIALITHHTDRDKIQRAVNLGVNYIIPKHEYELYGIHLDLLSKMK